MSSTIGVLATVAQNDDVPAPTDPKQAADIKADEEQGKKLMAQVEKELKLSKNKAYQERVSRIGQQMARVANHNHTVALWGDKRDNTFHYTFKVLEGDDINAFSLPGGHIYVYEGLVKFAESDDELAGILGHEISHAKFRHVALMEKEDSKMSVLQLPILIAAIIARSPAIADVGTATRLAALSDESKFSIKAEEAADYGGLQLLMKSNYNPVAMLTFMERLAAKERYLDRFERSLGILQTHPISRERAETMMRNLQAFNIPIKRSKASPSFRVTTKEGADGAVSLFFNSHRLYTFGGTEAHERAALAVDRLNDFFDAVPEMYDVSTRENEITWKGKMLLTIEPSDAEVANTTEDHLESQTISAIKQSLYLLAYRVWDGW